MDPLEFEDEDLDTFAQFATVPTLADEYGIGASTLYTAIASGRVVHRKIGGRILVDRKDAERYAKLHKLYKTNN